MKVGDYGRTIYGQITKIKYKWTAISTSRKPKVTVQCEDDELYDYPNEIKTSPNIIDLIKVGDYVNGERVTEITNAYIEVCYGRDRTDFINEQDIKSIVTKEQFEEMKYEIK